MKTIFDSCEPRTEVLKGELREEIFAARLKDVIEDKADPVYQDPATFFDNTYPTEGLKLLLDEVLGRLTGVKAANNAIIRLETAFGGGKTHNLIGLYHAANGYASGPSFVDAALIPTHGTVRVVGVVGSDLQPRDGLDHPSIHSGHRGDATTYTLWGELAYQLSGDPLRAVADHLLSALRANGHKATDLARAAGSETPFYLDELTGLRLALILLAVKPLARHDRIEAIGQGVQAMGDEEAYYWFSKCSAGSDALRAQRALRILLAGE